MHNLNLGIMTHFRDRLSPLSTLRLRNSGSVLRLLACLQLASAGSALAAPVIYGAVVINHGGVYSGTVVNQNPAVAAVRITTNEPVVIVNSQITSRGPLIDIEGTSSGANVVIENVTATALDPRVRGQLRGVFVNANNVAALTVANTTMTGVSFGVKVLSSNVSTLTIKNNVAKQLEDRESDGKGGLLAVRPDLGHFVILNQVSAPKGAEIGWNELIDTIGSSSTEDVINIYKSFGSEAHPIVAHDNYMEGFSSTTTPSYSGTGLITDGDASAPYTGYVQFINNEIVHTAGSGVEIASGHDVHASGNRVVSCGVTAQGSWYAMPYANALVLWNYRGIPNFSNNVISATAGGMLRQNQNGRPLVVDGWANTPDLTAGNSLGNNDFTDPCYPGGKLNLAAEDTERSYWKTKVISSGVKLGDQHTLASQ